MFLSKDGIFDLELLGLFNGKTGPIFMGVCGKVAAWSKGIHLTLQSLPTSSNASRSFHYSVRAASSFDTSKKTSWDTYYVTNVTYTHHIHITYTSYTFISLVMKFWPRSTFPPVITSRLGSGQFLLFSKSLPQPLHVGTYIKHHKALSPFELCAAFVILNFGPCDTPSVLFFHQLSSGSYQLQGANLCHESQPLG